jgi:hypothetical protein
MGGAVRLLKCLLNPLTEVGVYVFTKDASVHQAKTLALALAFGLTWKPVLAGIDSWTSMQLNQQNAATVSDAAAKLELAADHYLRGGGAAQRKASESGALSKAQQDDIEQLLREAQAAKSKMETLRR